MNRVQLMNRVRRTLRDLESPTVAPRLNAQVRVREESVVWLRALVSYLDAETELRIETQDRLRQFETWDPREPGPGTSALQPAPQKEI